MSPHSIPVAILAGGLATRLHPITETIPKSLVTVAGEPFIAHQLRGLKRMGVEDVVMCVGHLGEQIQQFVGDGASFGLRVQYSFDGEKLLGTAGALRRARPLLGPVFWVLYGDSYLSADLGAISTAFEKGNALGLMTVFENKGQWDKSNVRFEAGKILAYDKRDSGDKNHIDYGLLLLRAEALDAVSADQKTDLAGVLEGLVGAGKLQGHEVFERFYEIGSPEGVEETGRHIHSQRSSMSFTKTYLAEVAEIAGRLDPARIDRMIDILKDVRMKQGRLFILGVGGSAGNAGHAVNDFRKIVGIESYAPTDNVSELTARVNDDGWDTSFVNWLKGSRLRANDAILVFSVGGGNLEKNISGNLVHAVKYAKETGARVLGIVGRDGGYTAQAADACIIIPTLSPDTVTPHAEAFQAVVWHLIVSHPEMKANEMKWESVAAV